MKTIIIPTDFSNVATNAMNYGLDMAIDIKADVLLFHVYNVPVSMTEVPVMLISVDELQKNAEEQMASLKKKVEHIVSGKIKIETQTRLGDTVDELEALCKRVQPFAVIMGSRGASGIEALFGSTTLTAIRHLTSPVISVPRGKEYGQGIKKIGFACDFRDVADTLPQAVIIEVVKQFNAEFHVLNVSYNPKQFDKGSGEYVLLKTMLRELNPLYEFIQNEDVEEGINEFAEKNNLDLVITIPKKHKLLEGIFNKSSTRKLVFHSHIPVMCVHEY